MRVRLSCSRARGADVTQRVTESAVLRARELARSAETVWRERRRLIEDMRAVGEQLVAIGEAEDVDDLAAEDVAESDEDDAEAEDEDGKPAGDA